MMHCIVSLINKNALNKKRKKEKMKTRKERKEIKEKVRKKNFVFVMYVALYCLFNK